MGAEVVRYKAIIDARLEAFPKLSSMRILEEIRPAGYDGGYSQLTEDVRTVRPPAPDEPVIRFEMDRTFLKQAARLSRPPKRASFCVDWLQPFSHSVGTGRAPSR